MPSDWYDKVGDEDLRQGELLWSCPRIIHSPAALEEQDSAKVQTVHAAVITQSCDLVRRNNGRPKVEYILLCPFFTKAELASDGRFGSADSWEEVRKGRLPRFHILDRCNIDPIADEFLLVDLAGAFSVGFEVALKSAQRHSPRPRMRSPYLEHLSQAFARYYMRVGLPSDLPPFV